MQCGQSAALGASLRVGPAPKVVCRSKSVPPPLSPFLLGKPSAWFIPVCYSSTPLPGRIPPEVFRAAGIRPSRPLAQSVSGQTSHTLRGTPASALWRCTSIRRSVPVREDRCTPHQRHLALTPLSRPGSGHGGRLPTHIVGLFRCSREPVVSLPRRSRARRPHTSRPPPPPTLHCVPRPWSFRDSKAGARIAAGNHSHDITRATDQPLRL